jgi:hypothetical protein
MEGMGLRVQLPMPIYVDNEAAVNMTRNYISGGRTRHTAVRINFLQELQEHGHVVLQNVSGKDNRADIGTKNLDRATFERHGKWFHGVDDYYKEWRHTAGAKKEGVAGLAIFEPLGRLPDGFGHSDGLRWVQDGLDEPVVPFPTTI